MKAQELINEVEGLNETDTNEIQMRADKNLSECLKNYKGGIKNE